MTTTMVTPATEDQTGSDDRFHESISWRSYADGHAASHPGRMATEHTVSIRMAVWVQYAETLLVRRSHVTCAFAGRSPASSLSVA